MRRYGVIAALLVALVLGGCMQAEMLITVRSDGSGTIEVYSGMSKANLGMMGEMGEETDPFSEDSARENVSNFGEGVTFVSAEKIDTDETMGLRAIYAFEDINLVKASPAGEDANIEAKAMEEVTFSFDPADGGTLTVMMPGDDPESASENEVDEDGIGMMKGFLAGMRVSMKVEIDPGIASVNASRDLVDGNVLTLFEIDFDTIAEDTDNLIEFMRNSNSGPAIAGIEGVSYVQENPVVIEFGGGGGFPVLYLGVGALLVIFIVGVVMALKKK